MIPEVLRSGLVKFGITPGGGGKKPGGWTVPADILKLFNWDKMTDNVKRMRMIGSATKRDDGRKRKITWLLLNGIDGI